MTKVLKFYADWCGPCRMMKPILKDISEKYGVEVEDVDTESEAGKAQAEEFGVTTLPTLVIFKDGTKLDTIVGVVPKNILETKLEHLGVI